MKRVFPIILVLAMASVTCVILFGSAISNFITIPDPFLAKEDSWKKEAMAYIDRIIDKQDGVKGDLISADGGHSLYIYSRKSLENIKRYIANSRLTLDVTGAVFSASGEPFVYVDDRLVTNGGHFIYNGFRKTIEFVFADDRNKWKQ